MRFSTRNSLEEKQRGLRPAKISKAGGLGIKNKRPSVESSRLSDSTSFQSYQLRDPEISHVSPRKAQKPLGFVAINKGSPLTGGKTSPSAVHFTGKYSC